MRRFLQILTVVFVFLLGPQLVVAEGSPATQQLNSIERDALTPQRKMLDLGKNVASSACADCHGIDGVSTQAGMPNLAGQRMVYLYRVLLAYQDRERRNDAMNHAISFLNKDALLAVATYYASLPSARAAATDESPVASADSGRGDPFAGIRKDMKKCEKCHGKDGNAPGSGMPNLTAQNPEYFVASMKAYAADGRGNRLMSKLATGLDEETLNKIGVYYAVQEPLRSETTGDGNKDLGRELSAPCAACHGDDGNASGPNMPTIAGQDARYFVKAINAYQEGKRQNDGMFGAVESLSEEDVANLATFYAAQNPVRRNVRAPLTTGEWLDRCERCHGIDGNSTDPRFPMLAGQDRTYLANALQDYIGDSRSDSTMHAMSDLLSKADIESIVNFYTTREPRSVVYMQLPCEEEMED